FLTVQRPVLRALVPRCAGGGRVPQAVPAGAVHVPVPARAAPDPPGRARGSGGVHVQRVQRALAQLAPTRGGGAATSGPLLRGACGARGREAAARRRPRRAGARGGGGVGGRTPG